MTNETNMENVKKELMYEWDEEQNDEGDYVPVQGKQLMAEGEAIELLVKHKEVFEKGQRLGSFAYYTAQQILKAEQTAREAAR